MNDKYFNSILIKKSTFKDVRNIEKLIDKQARKLPWWVSGPPGTGKTRGFIKEKYQKLIEQGVNWERIVILSHTVNAAGEILDAIKEIPMMKNIPDNALENQICTIHSYFNAEGKKRKMYDLKHHKEFCKNNRAMRHWRKKNPKTPWDKHPLYIFCARIHGRRQTPNDHWRDDQTWYRDRGYDSLKVLNDLRIKYNEYREKEKVSSYEDMIDNFIYHSKAPTDIDVLIVDEAQDCNKPQVEALQKAATNVDEDNFIFVGDRDQSIYDYSGAYNSFFVMLERTRSYVFKKDEEPLDKGHRCGETINKICKNIINPQRKRLKLPEKEWTAAKGRIGKHYWIPRLGEHCRDQDALLDKIFNTKENFLFTYRGNPTDGHTKDFLERHGIDYKVVSENYDFISRKVLRCFDSWDNWYKHRVSLKQIKEYWPYLPGKSFKAYGKGNVKEAFKNVIDGDYNIRQLYEMGLVTEEALEYRPFNLAVKNSDDTKKIRMNVAYIKKILKNYGIEDKPRVEIDNIHKIKGLTYNNVVVNLSVYQIERNINESERLAYTAYSRGETDCWSIGSEMFNKNDRQTSLGGVQHDRGRIFSLYS
tara:strand:- start:153 stop:1916 length:1764 start_codon:yes stop_codon:yes gene_type:complete